LLGLEFNYFSRYSMTSFVIFCSLSQLIELNLSSQSILIHIYVGFNILALSF
jgi:hypothetical protein